MIELPVQHESTCSRMLHAVRLEKSTDEVLVSCPRWRIVILYSVYMARSSGLPTKLGSYLRMVQKTVWVAFVETQLHRHIM